MRLPSCWSQATWSAALSDWRGSTCPSTTYWPGSASTTISLVQKHTRPLPMERFLSRNIRVADWLGVQYSVYHKKVLEIHLVCLKSTCSIKLFRLSKPQPWSKPRNLQVKFRTIWLMMMSCWHFCSLCLSGLVVERIDSCASMYSRSIQGHHVCLLVKVVSEPINSSRISAIEGKVHPRMEIESIYSSPSSWKVRWSFLIHKTFLELHHKTSLQHPPKRKWGPLLVSKKKLTWHYPSLQKPPMDLKTHFSHTYTLDAWSAGWVATVKIQWVKNVWLFIFGWTFP